MSKDFAEVKRIIPGLGVTRRQAVAFMIAAAVGLPVYFILKMKLGMGLTDAVIGMTVVSFPVCYMVMYRKDGLYIEKHLKYF